MVMVMCRGRCGGSEIPQDAIHALDVALKHGTSLRPECQSFARAFFFYDPSIVRPLGNGAEVSLPFPLTTFSYFQNMSM